METKKYYSHYQLSTFTEIMSNYSTLAIKDQRVSIYILFSLIPCHSFSDPILFWFMHLGSKNFQYSSMAPKFLQDHIENTPFWRHLFSIGFLVVLLGLFAPLAKVPQPPGKVPADIAAVFWLLILNRVFCFMIFVKFETMQMWLYFTLNFWWKREM